MSRSNPSCPSSRDDFDTAIICALRLEFNAVTLLFDEFWDQDGDSYGKVPRDKNKYTLGRIGKRNVVLVLLPGMGKVNASNAAATILVSFNRVRVSLIVGICGGAPQDNQGRDIFLGDVIVSESAVQYDLGRLYPDGLQRKEGLMESLGKLDREIISFVKTLQTDIYQERLRTATLKYLGAIKNSPRNQSCIYKFPGITQDKLFKPTYRHRHHQDCSICSQGVSAC